MKKLIMAGLVLILGLSLLAGAGCKKEQPQGQVVARTSRIICPTARPAFPRPRRKNS
jgi:Ca2+/H+ antiporter